MGSIVPGELLLKFQFVTAKGGCRRRSNQSPSVVPFGAMVTLQCKGCFHSHQTLLAYHTTTPIVRCCSQGALNGPDLAFVSVPSTWKL